MVSIIQKQGEETQKQDNEDSYPYYDGPGRHVPGVFDDD